MFYALCKKHNIGSKIYQPDCIDCVRVTRDFLQEQVDSLSKMVETPTSKVFEEHVDPFIAKMSSRGVTLVSDPAVRYHLALLVQKLLPSERLRKAELRIVKLESAAISFINRVLDSDDRACEADAVELRAVLKEKTDG